MVINMRIKYKKKRRKSHKLYGQKYRGYGQVGRHRHHPGGRGRAGSKDHMKIHLLKKGHEFGAGKGFTRRGIEREWVELNVGSIVESIVDGKIQFTREDEKYVVDLSNMKYVKILGSGKVSIPIKLILNSTAKVSRNAQTKIEAAGGEIVIIGQG